MLKAGAKISILILDTNLNLNPNKTKRNTMTDITDLPQLCLSDNGEDWSKSFRVKSMFKPGKQGFVGILEHKENPGQKVVFKISQHLNYLVKHEFQIMQSLNTLTYCPHFCTGLGYTTCSINPRAKRTENPLVIPEGTKAVQKDILFMEYLEDAIKLYNYVKAEPRIISEEKLYAAIKQVLMAIAMAQQQQFTHYDLHSNNVLMKTCDPDLVFLYVLDKDNQFCIPTHGSYPNIIDFGFSYVHEMDDGPLWPSMGHTQVGFTSNEFNPIADPKLFLVTISGEIKAHRGTKRAKRLRRIVRNLFGPLDIDWDSGWERSGNLSASDCAGELLREYHSGSPLFKNYEPHCIDLIQSMIVLPLQPQNYDNIHIPYKTFLDEWAKFETQSTSPYYNLYVFKTVVDAARFVGPAYRSPKTRKAAIVDFKELVCDCITSVLDFCQVKEMNFEKLLCGLLITAQNLEGMLYDAMERIRNKQSQNYHKLPLPSIAQIYAALEVNIKDKYVFSTKSQIAIFDAVHGSIQTHTVSDNLAQNINQIHPLMRGAYLYDHYKNTLSV
jgi:hypothetical protein